MNIKFCLGKVSWLLSLATVAGSVQANTFSFTNGTVLICFRKSTTGATNLVVNAGPVSSFTNLAANQTVTIGAYTGAQLGQIGTNSIAWSAWTYFDSSAPASLQNTLYMSKPRASLNVQTSPYYRDKPSGQGQVISVLGAVVNGAVDEANYSSLNTTLAILEDSSYNLNNSDVSYYNGLGTTLDFQQTFQAQPDQFTPANFTDRRDAGAGGFLLAGAHQFFELRAHGQPPGNVSRILSTLDQRSDDLYRLSLGRGGNARHPVVHPERHHQHGYLHDRQHRHLHASRHQQPDLGNSGNQLAGRQLGRRRWRQPFPAGHHLRQQQVLHHLRAINGLNTRKQTKNTMNMKTTKILTAAIAAAVLCEAGALAQSFTYNQGDLLAAFGKTGSGNDLIVDLGSASLYQNAAGSSSFNITGVNSTLLTSAFGNLDNIYWTVFGYVGTTGSLGPQNTLFVSNPRADAGTQTLARHSLTSSAQGQVTSYMQAIVDGATSSAYGETVPANQIVELSNSLNIGGDPVSFSVGVNDFSGNSGNFGGTWIWDVRNFSPTGFAAGSTPSVSDLYQQTPGTANTGIYLGDFALNNNGTLAFNPVPEPSTWAMLGGGLLTLIAMRRRKN